MPATSGKVESGPGAAPRVALLTSSLGSGHMRAARAIETALREQCPGIETRQFDFWSLMDASVADSVRRAYLSLVENAPELYERLYQLDQRHWRDILVHQDQPPPTLLAEAARNFISAPTRVPRPDDPRHGFDRVLFRLLRAALAGQGPVSPGSRVWRKLLKNGIGLSWALMARRLYAGLRAFAPDVVVATQMHPATLFSLAKSRGWLDVPALAVLTDFGMHDFWHQPGFDLYCVPHASIAAEAGSGHRPGAMVATGIPLMPGFRDPPEPREARRQLQIDLDRPTVLVLGGGLGLGVDAVTERLLARLPDVQFLVLTGNNAFARTALTALADRYPGRLGVWGWSDQVAVFMRAADVVVGKPGGLTVAEALACGRPLLATHALRGQESFNVRFIEAQGVGRLVTEAALPMALESLLADRAELARIQQRAWTLGRCDAAARIAALTLACASASAPASAPASSAPAPAAGES